MDQLTVDVWSDIACPWCLVGKRRLEAALEGFAHREQVQIRWHAFELDPTAPRVHDPSTTYAGRLARKYRTTEVQAGAMIARMTETGAREGIDFRFDRIQSGNTFDAHRVLRLALATGGPALQTKMADALFRAYFTDGAAIGDPEVLARVAAEHGLEEDRVRAMLASDELTAEVRADERTAQELGIHGVPFFVLAEKYAVEGAQPPALLREALDRAWSDLPSQPRT